MERVKIKTTSWWPLAFGYLAMLTGFGLTALHDYKGLRVSEHKMPAPLASTTDATTVSDFEIKEWPRRLRTDLKGTSINVALPENGPDRPWNDALMAKFRELTGIEVETIRPGNDTSAVLLSYLREFATGSPRADVYAICNARLCSNSASALRLTSTKGKSVFRDFAGRAFARSSDTPFHCGRPTI